MKRLKSWCSQAKLDMKKSARVIELMASLGLCEQRLSLGYYITLRGQKLHSWAEHCQTCTFCNLCHSTYRGTVITSDYTYSTGLDVIKECVRQRVCQQPAHTRRILL